MLTERQSASLGPRELKAPGSVYWCWQVLGDLKTKWEHHVITKEWFEKVMGEVVEHRVWERVPPAQPYGSLDAMLQAELGETFDTATAKLTCREQGQQAAERTTGASLPQGKNTRGTNHRQIADDVQSTRATQNGVSPRTQRKLDHLARDYPALHACVVSGELSTHAAAKAAGIVKDPSPLTQLRRLWKKASPGERATFLADILEESPHA